MSKFIDICSSINTYYVLFCTTDEGEEGSEDDEGVCYSRILFSIISTSLSEHKCTWYRTFASTVCRSVCRSAKCIVAKWLIGSRCRLGGEWGWSREGCIRLGGYRRRGRALLGVKLRCPIVTSGAFVAQLSISA